MRREPRKGWGKQGEKWFNFPFSSRKTGTVSCVHHLPFWKSKVLKYSPSCTGFSESAFLLVTLELSSSLSREAETPPVFGRQGEIPLCFQGRDPGDFHHLSGAVELPRADLWPGMKSFCLVVSAFSSVSVRQAPCCCRRCRRESAWVFLGFLLEEPESFWESAVFKIFQVKLSALSCMDVILLLGKSQEHLKG